MAPQNGPWKRYYPRNVENAWRAIDDIQDEVDRMTRADEIAEAVAQKMSGRSRFRLSVAQKLSAILLAIVALTDLMLSILSHAHA